MSDDATTRRSRGMFEHAASAVPRDARGARPVVTLGRDDLERGLRALVSKLEASGVDARIQIVGGAAIALAYNAARRETVDIDAVVSPRDVVIASSAEIAADRGWSSDWLNDSAAQFLPSG